MPTSDVFECSHHIHLKMVSSRIQCILSKQCSVDMCMTYVCKKKSCMSSLPYKSALHVCIIAKRLNCHLRFAPLMDPCHALVQISMSHQCAAGHCNFEGELPSRKCMLYVEDWLKVSSRGSSSQACLASSHGQECHMIDLLVPTMQGHQNLPTSSRI